MENYELDLLKKTDTLLKSSIAASDSFITKSELIHLEKCFVEKASGSSTNTLSMGIFKLSRLAYNPEEGIVDKLVSVYSSMHSLNASVFIIIHGDEQGNTEFFVGCRSTNNSDAARAMLNRSFLGNFPGIELEEYTSSQKNDVLEQYFPLTYQRKSLAALSVSADLRKSKAEKNQTYIQGIEKFIDSMKGQSYTVLILAEPLSKLDCTDKQISLENIITELSKYRKFTIAHTENSSIGITESLSKSVSKTVSKSISHSISKNTSKSIGKSRGENESRSEPYYYWDGSRTTGSNSGHSKTTTKGTTKTKTDGVTDSEAVNDGETKGTSKTDTSGTSVTLNIENKHISELIAKIEYELKKLENADSFGLWDTAIYVLSGDENTALIGANSIRSFMIGDESGKSESFINHWGNSIETYNESLAKVIEFLHYGMHPVFSKRFSTELAVISQDDKHYFTPAISVGGNVLPTLLGLPLKSVPGVTVIETAEFGRNIVTDDRGTPGNRKMRLGEITYMGKLDNTEVQLYVNSISSHAFVCGAPGSGKSNTIYRLLYGFTRLDLKPERDSGYGNVHFLVIEPAKGEYKYEFGKNAKYKYFHCPI